MPLRIFLFSLWWLSFTASAACLPPDSKHSLRQEANWYLVDGDTLHFSSRKKLRLAMINAPELGRDGRPDQPFAKAATEAVHAFLGEGDLTWRPGNEAKDRYGRWLGSVLNDQGEWLAAHLVSQGLAYAISVGVNEAPPCLWRLEAQAKRLQLGLWASALGHYHSSQGIGSDESGFMLLRGTVDKIAAASGHWYVDLEGAVTLKIKRQQWQSHAGDEPTNWLGKEVRVRGWVSWRKLSKQQRQRGFKPAVLYVQHPHMLSVD